MDAAAPPPAARLNGWKEIAGYFGRTVRTVQRWERELGLPIHRLSTGRGETVFALVDELDRWMADNERAAGTAGQNGHGSPDANGSSSDANGNGYAAQSAPGPVAAGPGPIAVEPAPPVGRSRRAAFIVGGVLVLLAAASSLAMWYVSGSPGRVPSAFEREGRDLTVFDQAGRPLWRWRAPFEPSEVGYADERRDGRDPAHFVDLEGDGRIETVFHAPGRRFEDGGVFVFEEDGTLRFSWSYRGRKRFGDQTYAPPWVVSQVNVRKPAAGRPEIWATIKHAPWFPSAVMRLDAAGNVTGEYWHPGHISEVVPARLDGRDVLLVGAGHNEFRTASLAVVDPAISSTAPATKPDYRCLDCPAAAPQRYFLFPRLLLAREFDAVSAVTHLRIDAVGQVVVSVEHLGVNIDAGSEGPVPAQVYYILDASLRCLSAELGDTYVRTYRSLQAEGRFTRPIDRNDQSELWPIREWKGSAFVPLPVPRPRG